VVARLSIQKIHLRAMVREGSDDETLDVALGHIPGTALPGQRGNVGVAGHRDTIFRHLAEVGRDDQIQLQTPSKTYVYQVDDMAIVKPEAVSVLTGGRDSRLTLVTCYPFNYIGSAPKRYIVKAHLVSHAQRYGHNFGQSAVSHRHCCSMRRLLPLQLEERVGDLIHGVLFVLPIGRGVSQRSQRQVDQFVDHRQFHVFHRGGTGHLVIGDRHHVDDSGLTVRIPVDVAQGVGLQVARVGGIHRELPVVKVEALLPECQPRVEELRGGGGAAFRCTARGGTRRDSGKRHDKEHQEEKTGEPGEAGTKQH